MSEWVLFEMRGERAQELRRTLSVAVAVAAEMNGLRQEAEEAEDPSQGVELRRAGGAQIVRHLLFLRSRWLRWCAWQGEESSFCDYCTYYGFPLASAWLPCLSLVLDDVSDPSEVGRNVLGEWGF